MAFNVNFYQFAKRENSTAQPQSGARVFPCIIRNESGVINPTIEIDLPITENPSQYNYAYIPNFNRYYFVDEWKFADRLWIANLSVDVLATYKTEIGNHDLYILRASAEYDGRVVDKLYPTKVDCDFDVTSIGAPWAAPGSGNYIIACVGKNPIYGSCNYVVLNSAGFRNLIKGLLDDTIEEEFGFNEEFVQDVGRGLVLSLVDPLQYIKGAMFFPIPLGGDGINYITSNTIEIFNYEINITDGGGVGGTVTNALTPPFAPMFTKIDTFTLEKHPQTQSRGNYVNTAPYTLIQLIYPPFGTIELDTTVLSDVNQLTTEIRIDLITGIGILEVKANGITLNKVETQIGVPMQLSQITRDYLGAFNNTMAAGANIANSVGSLGSAFSTEANPIGAVGGAVANGFNAAASLGNAAASLVPRAQSIGSGGSFAQLYENARVEYQFFEIVDDDISQNGRPLCKIKKPNTIPGFMVVQDGDVPTTATAQENRLIRAYLESGFYFE